MQLLTRGDGTKGREEGKEKEKEENAYSEKRRGKRQEEEEEIAEKERNDAMEGNLVSNR